MQVRADRPDQPVVAPQRQLPGQPRYGTDEARRLERRKLLEQDKRDVQERDVREARVRERRDIEATRRAEEARIVAIEERAARTRETPDPGPAYLVSLSTPASEPLRARLQREEQQSPLGRQIDMYA